jgi:predicted PurR-regulated permease PerM
LPEEPPDSPAPAADVDPSNPFRTRQLWLTAAIVILALWIARPFLTPIAWATVIAVAEWPLLERLAARNPARRQHAAVALALGTGLLVVLPLSMIATSVAAESKSALAWLDHAQQTGVPTPAWLRSVPLVGEPLFRWWQEHAASSAAARELLGSVKAGSALAWARTIASAVAWQSGLFLVTLVTLLALLRHGDRLAGQVQVLSLRVFGQFGRDFLLRMTTAIRRTVLGTLLVSTIEGSLIGAGYFLTGVPEPLLFTVATVLLALVPFGAWLVFGLAGLILVLQGHLLLGLLLIGFGAVVMTVGDNLVQPAVIGGAVELPFLLAFVGAFGGLLAMGLVGLFVGPVIMVALLVIWREWTGKGEAGSRSG